MSEVRTGGGASAFSSKEFIAGIGVGVAFSALEAWRYPIFGVVSSEGPSSFESNFAAIAALLLCCAYYAVRRRRIARRNAFVIAVAALSSVSLFCYGRIQLGLSSPSFLEVPAFLQMGFSVVLFMLWMEELVRMPDEHALSTMVIGFLSTFLIQASVILLDKSMAWGVCSLLPLLSGVFFVCHRYALQSTFGFLGSPRGSGPRGFDASLDIGEMRQLVPTMLVTFFCGVVFSLLNGAWRGSDVGLTDAGFVQFNSALGSLVAGVVVFALRRSLRLGTLEMLIVLFSLSALLMEKLTLSIPVLFLIPLNVAQKLAFLMFLLAVQKLDDRALRSLAYCAIFLVYRVGLFVRKAMVAMMTGIFALEESSATYLLTFIGTFAMVAFVVYEMATANDPAPGDSHGEREAMEQAVARYKSMAFNYYLAQRLGLTQREAGVMSLLTEDSSADAIAKELSISKSTVKTHLHNIYTKVGVHSQKEFLEFVENERRQFFSLPAGEGADAGARQV